MSFLRAAEVATGAMIALRPSITDAQRIAMDEGEPAERLHVTLYYLGKADTFDADTRAALVNAITGMVERRALPVVQANGFAASMFNPGGEEPCWVLLLGDIPDATGENLAVVRGMVSEALHDGMVPIDLPPQHTPWHPHITVAYTGEMGLGPDVAERVGPVTFDAVRVAFAGAVTDIPLTASTRSTTRDFDPGQPRDDHGRWTDGGSKIFSKRLTFGFGDTALDASAHTGKRVGLAVDGGHEVQLTKQDMATLRKKLAPSYEWEVGGSTTLTHAEERDGSVYTTLAVRVEKVYSAGENDIGPDDDEWYVKDRFMVRPAPNDDPWPDELKAAPGVELTHEQLFDLLDELDTMTYAERVDTGHGTVDMYVDGRSSVLKPDGGPEVVLNRKSARALSDAIADLDEAFDPDGGEPMPAGETLERTVTTNAGPIGVSLQGGGDLVITLPGVDTPITVTPDRMSDFVGQLGWLVELSAPARSQVGPTLLVRSKRMTSREPGRGPNAGIRYARAYAQGGGALAGEPAGSPIPFVASTMGLQRDNIDLRASGWSLKNFASNPVFLWCHNYDSEPIGRTNATSDLDRLRANVTFDQEDERARRIESKYRRGFLSAVSVGWDFVDEQGRQLEWWRMTPEQMRDEAFYDLLELSGVPVPADPNALAIRQRTALRSLSRELADLLDAQEHPDSDALAHEVRAALRDELSRLGIDINTARAKEPPLAVGWLRASDLPTELRRLGMDLPNRAAIPAHDTKVVEGEWDGPAAQANCPAEKGPLRSIHAWVDSDGDENAKSSYSFPHHAEPGGPANLNGVRNALARLSQADIPDADRAAVERHLRNHLDAQPDGDRAHTESSAARAAAVDQDEAQLVLAAFGDLNL